MSCQHGNWPPCDQCDELDAAWDRGYAEGGKASIDLTMKHLRRAEAAESRLAAVEANAQRYAWLRLAGVDADISEKFVNICESEPATPELFDQAIDSAIRHIKEKS